MDVLIEEQDGVVHVTLNRPVKRNALTMQMCKDIVAAVKSARACSLITANGATFCAGMDLGERPLGDELLKVHEELFTLGAQAQKPIVVAVNGRALGGGLGLAAQGHVVLASPSATFGLPELKIGFWPFVVYRSVEAAIGRPRTLAASLTCESFSADHALAWGLVHQIHVDVDEAGKRIARDIAKSSPSAIASGMRYVRESEGKTGHEAGEIAAKLRAELAASADYKEGTAAFREKREPHWPSLADRS